MKKRWLLTLSLILVVTLLSLGGYSTSSAGMASQPDFPNAKLLVSADSVQKNLYNPKVVVIDARSSGYSDSHIPRAINLKYGDYLTPGTGLKDLATLQSQLGAAGLKPNKKIVIYDDTTASWGAAGRVFWMLEYLGCKDVHILDGGWDKWVADGRPTKTKIRTLPRKNFVAVVNSDILATSSHILERLTALDETNSYDDFAIVDARTNEEYIGWQFYGEARGGHIPKAVNIPYEWFFNDDKTVLKYQDLRKIFEDRGITIDKEVTSYCTEGIRSGYVYFLLRLMGYPRVSNYDASILEWNADSSLPMSKLPNYQMVVNAEWVNDLISGKNPSTYPGHGYVIIDAMSWRGGDNTDEYNAGHIPGAIHLNYYALEGGYPVYPYTRPSDGNLLPDAQLQTFIENLGIAYNMTVVLYSKNGLPNRPAWALMYAGVEDVRILNGGYGAWVANGGVVETTPNTPTPVPFGITVPGHPEYLATTTDVQAIRLDPSGALGDMRSWEEFIGQTNPYERHAGFTAKGRIPGEIWINNSNWYINADGTLRSYTEVAQMWRDRGITADKRIAFY